MRLRSGQKAILPAARALLRCALAWVLVFSHPGPAHAIELKPKTRDAYDRYIHAVETARDDKLRKEPVFFWFDALPDARRREQLALVQRGEIAIQRPEVREEGRTIKIPDGMVHHWVGVAFFPGANLEETLTVLQDYDHHAEVYAPRVRRSKLLSHTGDDFHFAVQFYRKSPRTVAINGEFEAHFARLSPTRAVSRSVSTRFAELSDPEKPDSTELAPDKNHGYLWRMNTYWNLEEKDGGVYAQIAVVGLSRDVPLGFGWLVHPIVRRIARESLVALLTDTRKVLLARHASAAAP